MNKIDSRNRSTGVGVGGNGNVIEKSGKKRRWMGMGWDGFNQWDGRPLVNDDGDGDGRSHRQRDRDAAPNDHFFSSFPAFCLSLFEGLLSLSILSPSHMYTRKFLLRHSSCFSRRNPSSPPAGFVAFVTSFFARGRFYLPFSLVLEDVAIRRRAFRRRI